ncbi:MAG: heme-binding beta-barrel domain-containing protein [Acidimicrobiales bacterium]
MTLGLELGPLEGLVGSWEGEDGLDVSYANSVDKILETPYREKVTFLAFGPVENGSQVLYGLDYRMEAWREGGGDPFHAEVGYWLWDAAAGQVMRCFMVPRGVVVLAGGQATPGDRTFHLEADIGSTSYGILSNQFLATAARTTRYEVSVNVGDATFSYEETTTIEHARVERTVLHTDRNTLRRVDAAS